MADELPIPEELKHLLEKREEEQRRTAERRSESDSTFSPELEQREHARRQSARRSEDSK